MANAPYISEAWIDDINSTTVALTGNSHILVRYFSTAYVEAVWASDNSTIDLDSCIMRNGGDTQLANHIGASRVGATFVNVASDTFYLSAQDANGNVGQRTVTPKDYGAMVDYIKLTCNVLDSRPDATGQITLTCYGDCFVGSFGAQDNTLSVQYRYRQSGGTWSGWNTMTAVKYTDSYVANATKSGLDYQKSYDFEFIAMDRLMSATASSSKVKSVPVFHWSENDVVFEVPVTFNGGTTGASLSDTVDGNLNVTGNLKLKGSGNYGNYLLFGDGTYCYIAELEDDVMTLKAKRINIITTETDGFTVNGSAAGGSGGGESGEWTPFLESGVISSYTTQRGWYSKVGNVVTVGFFIKVRCLAGYNDYGIIIYGLPYYPTQATAGGGLCSKAYMTANHNFQCYVAETNGSITTRSQACDGTSGTNLTTSAGGCKFPNISTEITLSGTITYLTS